MKKFCFIFILFSLFVFVSCGGSSKNDKNDNSDSGETVSDDDSDTADTEPTSDNEPGGDTGTDTTPDSDNTTPDSGDTTPDSSDTTPDSSDTTPDSGDSEPDDADTTDSTDDTDSSDSGDDADSSDSGDDTDSTADEDVDTGDSTPDGDADDDTDTVIEQMNEEKCIAESGTWDAANNKCRKTVNCDSKPEDLTEWNGATTYISEYVDGAWTKVETEHNEEEGPCHFVCEEYVDDERFEYYEPLNKCLDPFEAECVHEGYEGAFMDYDYEPPVCVCPSGYHFGKGADSKKCIVMDMNECSASSTFPCTDSDTGYIWSEKTTETMDWLAAKQHCEALGDDWHLPTISELRTLILKCNNLSEMGGMCDVSDNCLSEALCSHTESNSKGCHDGCGTCVNKFSEGSFVWSQSILEDNPNAAYIVNFAHGQIISQPKGNSNLMNVRCVRNTTTNPVTDLEKCIRIGGKMDNEGKCLKSIKCDMRPSTGKWNGAYSYIREYSDGTWLGEKIETIYSTEAGVCHFVCTDNYPSWDGNNCVEAATGPCASNPCADIANSSCTESGETFECICNEGFGKVDGECKPYCAAVFDGTSSYLKLNKTQSTELYSNAWTIEAWIKQANFNDMYPLAIMQYREKIAYMLTAFSKKTSTSVLVGGALLTSGGQQSVSVTMETPAAGWHHIALVNTGSQLALFIDGSVKDVQAYTGSPKTVENSIFAIGRATNYSGSGSVSTGTNSYFKGAIDQFRFSNIARYAANFTPAPLTGDDENTVALWDFNGNANNSKSDSLHLTATNITYTTECR